MTDRPERVEGTEEELDSCLTCFVAYACDQLAHLRARSVGGAEYVGRRLDQSWRWLDLTATRWLDARYPQSRPAGDVLEVLFRTRRVPPFRPDGDHPAGAFAQLRTTIRALDLVDPSASEEDDLARAAIGMHLARRSFSAYRLHKYAWLDEQVRDHGYDPHAYRWLET